MVCRNLGGWAVIAELYAIDQEEMHLSKTIEKEDQHINSREDLLLLKEPSSSSSSSTWPLVRILSV